MSGGEGLSWGITRFADIVPLTLVLLISGTMWVTFTDAEVVYAIDGEVFMCRSWLWGHLERWGTRSWCITRFGCLK